jgi:hypothetical protein
MAAGGSAPAAGRTGSGEEGTTQASGRPSAGPRVPLRRTATSRHATMQATTTMLTHTIV